jgi:uncharacterized protein
VLSLLRSGCRLQILPSVSVLRYPVPMHYLLFYDVVEGYAERRVPFREAHLAHAKLAIARGELVLGGALCNPLDWAVILFQGDSAAAAEAFAKADPYVQNGLVERWYVREWHTVVGRDAAHPALREGREAGGVGSDYE